MGQWPAHDGLLFVSFHYYIQKNIDKYGYKQLIKMLLASFLKANIKLVPTLLETRILDEF